MKTLILCGGNGLRIKGIFNDVPKPLIPIQGKPLLSYIIEIYKKYNFNDFILLVGDNLTKFQEFKALHKDVNITVLETGLNTPTGERILKAKDLLDDSPFFLTYGDGISNIDISSLLKFHKSHNLMASLTAVKPQLPYGLLNIDANHLVTSFVEKPTLDQFVNGGFFVINPEVFDLLCENSDFENDVLPLLSKNGQLCAYPHTGFWKSIDTYKDYLALEELSLENSLL